MDSSPFIRMASYVIWIIIDNAKNELFLFRKFIQYVNWLPLDAVNVPYRFLKWEYVILLSKQIKRKQINILFCQFRVVIYFAMLIEWNSLVN